MDSSKRSADILQLRDKFKNIMPRCLRICDTFFTMMIVVGDFSGTREIPLNKEQDDHVNAIVSIGYNVIEGGMTVYYSGVNMKHVEERKKICTFQTRACTNRIL